MLLASSNIQYGLGRDNAYDLARLARAVEAADIIAFQEVVRGFDLNRRADQAAELGRLLNRYWVYGAGFDVDNSTLDPAGRVVNRRRQFGNMVASRWPIRASRTIALPRRPYHGVFDVARAAIEAVIETPDGAFRVYSVHLSHIHSEQRARQIAHLLDQIGRAPDDGAPWDGTGRLIEAEGLGPIAMPRAAVVMGDFNCQADDPEYAMLCGPKDRRRGRLAAHDQLVDSWVAAGHDAMQGKSCHAEGKSAERYKIDYILLSQSLAGAVQGAWIDEAAIGSDHNPIFAELAP